MKTPTNQTAFTARFCFAINEGRGIVYRKDRGKQINPSKIIISPFLQDHAARLGAIIIH